MNKTKLKYTGGRITPALLIIFLTAGFASASMLRLEKTRVLYVEMPVIYSVIPGLPGSWIPFGEGYIYAKAHELCFYASDLRLLHRVKLEDTTDVGATQYEMVDDSILYVLGCGRYIESFDRKGSPLGRRFLPKGADVDCMAFCGEKIMLAGSKEILPGYWVPELMILDTLNPDRMAMIKDLFPASVIAEINKSGKGEYASLSVSSYKDGFIATSALGPEVFFISPEGKLKSVIRTTPPGYKYLKDAPALDRQRSYTDQNYFRQWQSTFENAWIEGVFQDSLLVVKRRSFLDVYNVNAMSFLDRIELSEPGIGFPYHLTFVRDSTGREFLRVSEFRLDFEAASDDNQVKTQEPPAFDSCRTCGKPIVPYGYAESDVAQDSLYAGEGRFAHVYSSSAFEPDSLARFCAWDKKSMFIFVHPADFRADLLLDTTLKVLNGRKDWEPIIVLCYPKPDELKLFLPFLPGKRILVNRNQAVPDKTIALGDLRLTPLLVAYSEAGRELLGAHSLGPRYDDQKIQYGKGITFGEFLSRCGIVKPDSL
ncbi:hypothetical protein GX441_12025 [bacterium]|nr:hypothetical protein [bacterium]